MNTTTELAFFIHNHLSNTSSRNYVSGFDADDPEDMEYNRRTTQIEGQVDLLELAEAVTQWFKEARMQR